MKIEPKAIGVGQYQHDVNQTQLARKLDAVVEDCVNAGGCGFEYSIGAIACSRGRDDENLSAKHCGIRDENGRFESRSELKKCRV